MNNYLFRSEKLNALIEDHQERDNFFSNIKSNNIGLYLVGPFKNKELLFSFINNVNDAVSMFDLHIKNTSDITPSEFCASVAGMKKLNILSVNEHEPSYLRKLYSNEKFSAAELNDPRKGRAVSFSGYGELGL